MKVLVNSIKDRHQFFNQNNNKEIFDNNNDWRDAIFQLYSEITGFKVDESQINNNNKQKNDNNNNKEDNNNNNTENEEKENKYSEWLKKNQDV